MFRAAQLLTGEVVVAMLAAAIFGLMPRTSSLWCGRRHPRAAIHVFMLAALVFLIQRKPGWSRGLILSALLCVRNPHARERNLFSVIAFAYLMLFEAAPANDTRPRAGRAPRAPTPISVAR